MCAWGIMPVPLTPVKSTLIVAPYSDANILRSFSSACVNLEVGCSTLTVFG